MLWLSNGIRSKIGKKERSRRRQAWTEGWEGDRQARACLLQAVTSKAQEAQRWSASQVQEIPLKGFLKNNERSLYK
jgi:hypothetical protein